MKNLLKLSCKGDCVRFPLAALAHKMKQLNYNNYNNSIS